MSIESHEDLARPQVKRKERGKRGETSPGANEERWSIPVEHGGQSPVGQDRPTALDPSPTGGIWPNVVANRGVEPVILG